MINKLKVSIKQTIKVTKFNRKISKMEFFQKEKVYGFKGQDLKMLLIQIKWSRKIENKMKYKNQVKFNLLRI